MPETLWHVLGVRDTTMHHFESSILFKSIKRFFSNEAGTAAVEYGLIISVIAGVIAASALDVGQHTGERFDCTSEAVEAAVENGDATKTCD